MTKDEAEAAKAEAEAEKARLDNEERKGPLAQQKRDAELKAAIAKAEKETAEATLTQFTSLVPDFSAVDRGKTTVTGDNALFASALALRALEAAAVEAAKDIKRKLGDDCQVLLTIDPDLATTDAAYLETTGGLTELHEAASTLLKREGASEGRHIVSAAGVVAALASAVPSVLSLLSAHRAVSTQAIAGDDLLSVMRLAAALAESDPGATVLLDDFRVLHSGHIANQVKAVREKRQELVVRKLDLAGQDPQREATTLGLIEGLMGLIDSYLAAIFKVPDGGKRSPYTNAVLREQIHTGTVRHVVLVKGCSGSTQQLVNDRPLWWEDKFSTVASMGISYVIVRADDGRICGGGIRSASRSISGTIGSSFVIDSVGTPEFE